MGSSFIKQPPYHTINHGALDGRTPVGYCWCDLHKGYLMVPHLKKHDCIGKGCVWFQPNPNHPFLGEKEFSKSKRKLRQLCDSLFDSGKISHSVYYEMRRHLRTMTRHVDMERFMTHYKKYIVLNEEKI